MMETKHLTKIREREASRIDYVHIAWPLLWVDYLAGDIKGMDWTGTA